MSKELIKQILVAAVLLLAAAAFSDEIIAWLLKIQGDAAFIDMPR